MQVKPYFTTLTDRDGQVFILNVNIILNVMPIKNGSEIRCCYGKGYTFSHYVKETVQEVAEKLVRATDG